jgi:DNA-dependent RNA polymerase auxiliary subunit epsilon
MNILPLFYNAFDKKIASYDFLNEYINLHPNEIAKSNFEKILNINCTYKPVWGIKIDLNGNSEYEAYFYQYIKDKFIGVDELNFHNVCNILDIHDVQNEGLCVLLSCDVDKPIKSLNQYIQINMEYYIYSYSILNNVIQNHYYVYTPDKIKEAHRKFFDPYFINKHVNKYSNSLLSSIGIADKTVRNYICVYYDGVSCEQLKKLLSDFNVNIPFIDKYKDDYFSISLDYDKSTDKLVRIGIYGLLY